MPIISHQFALGEIVSSPADPTIGSERRLRSAVARGIISTCAFPFRAPQISGVSEQAAADLALQCNGIRLY